MKALPTVPPVFLLAFAAAGAAAAPPELRRPSKPWVVDYGETICSATRFYDNATDPMTLGFVPSPSGTVVRVAVIRSGKGPVAHDFDVTANVSNRKLRMSGIRFASADKKSDVAWINFEREVLDRMRDAGEIAIKGGGLNERFALPGFGAVLKALDTCSEDLRRHWNADQEHDPRLLKHAEPLKPLTSYISSDDYPTAAVRAGNSGTTGVVLMVDESGTAKNCMVDETSGYASLDLMSCHVFVRRAKFRPALDAAGKPVRSVLTQRIRWVVPN